MSKLTQRIIQIRRVSRLPAFLQARVDAEEEAHRLLDERAGRFTKDEFHRFLDLCNTELVPPSASSNTLRESKTRTRFQQSFIGANRSLMLEKLGACNDLIGRVWHAKGKEKELEILDSFWQSTRVKGAGTGLPTMIIYLKHPKTYSVWLVSLNKPLSSIAGQPLANWRSVDSYLLYNRAVNDYLRRRFSVKPQEIDYILYRLLVE